MVKKKISRNKPCPCGSGKKYKHCCGSPLATNATFENRPPNLKIQAVIKKALEEQQAKEAIRKKQQGLGKPIIATKFNDYQMVAVGNTIHYSPKWQTFADFLFDHIKTTIGEEWGNVEIKKPLEERHPILQWYDKCCAIQKKHSKGEGVVQLMPPTGAVYCYLGLAYNLYLLKHNVELQKRYTDRLKDINNFQGAYYELIVANCLIRAGFELELEDEDDSSSKHCEFSARSQKTGKKFWVEAKARSVAGVLGKTDANGTTRKDPTCMLSKHVRNALEKPAEDERLIFVDVNTSLTAGEKPVWIERAEQKLDMKEKDLNENQSAYVFVTNMGFHWALDSDNRGHALLAHGLGISDFAKPGAFRLSEVYKAKKKHIDAHNIIAAFGEYPKIPETFDGSMPSETFGGNSQQIKIGETYFFEYIGEKGLTATVTTATVNEKEKIIYIGTDKGQILTRPISDEELEDYKKYPDEFFGAKHRQPRNSDDPYEFFENLVEIHLSYPKSYVLKQLENWPNFKELSSLEHEDLVVIYCESLVANLQNQKKPT